MRRFYGSIIFLGESLQSYLLLALRLFWGWSFLWAGWGKLHNIANVTNFFKSLHIPFPEFNAHLVGWVETIGGACLIAGLASRAIAIPLIITMCVALYTDNYKELIGMFKNQQAFATAAPVTYLIVSLVTLSFGPGKFSLDGFCKRFIFKG